MEKEGSEVSGLRLLKVLGAQSGEGKGGGGGRLGAAWGQEMEWRGARCSGRLRGAAGSGPRPSGVGGGAVAWWAAAGCERKRGSCSVRR
jgi:hypothetical protein